MNERVPAYLKLYLVVDSSAQIVGNHEYSLP